MGCGPGSFAGVRIGVAAARALVLGWQAPVRGFSTLALVAAGAADAILDADGGLVAMEGGHGQWFVQSFAADLAPRGALQSLYPDAARSEEHTSELQSLMRISYAVFCLKKQTDNTQLRNRSH